MARLNVYVPDDLAERARRAGLNISALAQAAILAELDKHATAAWLDALPHPARRASHRAALTALDAARGDFGSDGD
jgi:post-segregation antitoxin (ccd killing protein)